MRTRTARARQSAKPRRHIAMGNDQGRFHLPDRFRRIRADARITMKAASVAEKMIAGRAKEYSIAMRRVLTSSSWQRRRLRLTTTDRYASKAISRFTTRRAGNSASADE